MGGAVVSARAVGQYYWRDLVVPERTALLGWLEPRQIAAIEARCGVRFTPLTREEGAYGKTLLDEVRGDDSEVVRAVQSAILATRGMVSP